MSTKEEALRLHKENQGKISIKSKVSIRNSYDLSIAYTPGVAEPCREIFRDEELVDTYTSRGNLVAVVSDGSAVLGLGNIGAKAALPVMEGKAILFKAFSDVDAFPVCIATQDKNEIVETVLNLEPTFGGINLEDIAAPKCFYIEKELKKRLNIPVFHDDQHGTAVVVAAAIINSIRILDNKISNLRVLVNGSGAAGIAVSKLLLSMGVEDLIICDRDGAIYEGKPSLDGAKQEIAVLTNKNKIKGSLSAVIKGRNAFIGVSAPNVLTKDMVATMEKDSIIFAMANPDPEILPDEAKAGGARIVGTGRSDFPNQVNNVLGFPGIFRGALDIRAVDINETMKIAASKALAGLVEDNDLREDFVLPHAFDLKVAPRVAGAVAEAAVLSRVARIEKTALEVERDCLKRLGLFKVTKSQDTSHK
ncbi:MAG: NAD-dependent malic enzyme [Actinobacteria bacterium]|nr:NAD-dependent malic enzyme [Actinomycetota bacterium]